MPFHIKISPRALSLSLAFRLSGITGVEHESVSGRAFECADVLPIWESSCHLVLSQTSPVPCLRFWSFGLLAYGSVNQFISAPQLSTVDRLVSGRTFLESAINGCQLRRVVCESRADYYYCCCCFQWAVVLWE